MWMFFSALVVRDYGQNDMMWMHHELRRQREVPSHWRQTKFDTSVQWCSTTSPNFIMKATPLRGRQQLSSPFIFSPSILLLGCVGLRSRVIVMSLKRTCVYVWTQAWMWDSCHLSSYQSPFNVNPPRAQWHQLRANYSTGDHTDESWTRERWLSMCVTKSVCSCVCVCGFVRMCGKQTPKKKKKEPCGLNATLTSVKVHCVFVCVNVCLWVCTK